MGSDRLLGALASWTLKTSKEGEGTAALPNLSYCLAVLMVQGFFYIQLKISINFTKEHTDTSSLLSLIFLVCHDA